jgi:LysM repeat protein
MKIYINNLNLEILPNIMTTINEQYIDTETYIQIYAIDGVYQINDAAIKKLNPLDSDIQIHHNYYDNFTLIVDPSYYTAETVNKIPLEHITTKMKRCFFQINKKSAMKLVVEGAVIEDSPFAKKPTTTSTTDYGMKPTDIYFEVAEDIDITDALIKREINVFLSMLN